MGKRPVALVVLSPGAGAPQTLLFCAQLLEAEGLGTGGPSPEILHLWKPGSPQVQRPADRDNTALLQETEKASKADFLTETPSFGAVSDLQAEGEAPPGAARPRSLPASPQRAAGAPCSLRAARHGSVTVRLLLGYGSAGLCQPRGTVCLQHQAPLAPSVLRCRRRLPS